MITELRHRDPLLFWIGAAHLLALLVCTLLSISDTRLILNINPWIKPMKFLVTIPIFLWSVAWFMPETRPDARLRAIVRWTISLAMALEAICIILQAARGTTSHYNVATTFDATVFNLMGLGVLVNTIAMGIFLWLLRRDTPASRAGYLWGVRLGTAIFLIGSIEGVLMLVNGAHTIGAPDGGPGLPFVNWSTSSGDLRVVHFFGIHALQALPLLGFVTNSRNLVAAGSILGLAAIGGLLWMASHGRPLIAM